MLPADSYPCNLHMQGSTPPLETIFSWERCRLDVPACFIVVERVAPDSFGLPPHRLQPAASVVCDAQGSAHNAVTGPRTFRPEHQGVVMQWQPRDRRFQGENTLVRRIPTTELRTAMYIHKLGGSWWKHPFVRGSFLLTDPSDIATMLEYGIREVWVDPSKEAAHNPEPAASSAKPATPCAPPGKDSQGAAPMADEVARAKTICLAAKNQVIDMFHA